MRHRRYYNLARLCQRSQVQGWGSTECKEQGEAGKARGDTGSELRGEGGGEGGGGSGGGSARVVLSVVVGGVKRHRYRTRSSYLLYLRL